MTMRPRRPGIARTLSERARQAAADPAPDLAKAAEAAGQFGLGGLFEGLREMAEKLGKLAESQGGSSQDFAAGAGRVVFGYSVRTGLDGGRAEPFGHVPEPDAPPTADTARQPIVDVFEEPETITVVAELPGAAETGVTCRMQGAALLIEATGARRYRKLVTLPAPVDPASLRQTLRNGILEVRLQRLPGSP